MNISILMDAPLRKTLFSEKVIKELEQIGKITYNCKDSINKEELIVLVKDADIAITSWGVPTFDEDVLNACPNLKLIAHAAGSVKSIVSDEMYARNIKIVSGARALSEGVSDTALGLTICACKNVFALSKGVSGGKWIDDYMSVTEMNDITVGVIGCGFAGKRYIQLLNAFNIDVLVYDPNLSTQQAEELNATKVELNEIFTNSDVISLHAPELESTYHIINEQSIKLMKDSAILINTARGSLIDENALIKALKEGKFKYVCLDVTDPEPPAIESELRNIENCIITPHIAGCANNGKLKLGTHSLAEIKRFLENKELISEITKEMLSTIA